MRWSCGEVGVFALVLVTLTGAALARAEEPSSGQINHGKSSPNQMVSVDFKDADIRQVLRMISIKTGMDIIAEPDVTGLVTIKLHNTSWKRALEAILKTHGFTSRRKGKVIWVMRRSPSVSPE